MDDTPGASERVLVAQAAAGSRRAFETLAGLWWERIRAYTAAALAGDPELGEEAAQDALLRLYRALPRFRGDSSFGTFLYRVCRNAAVDLLRARVRERSHGGTFAGAGEDQLPSAHRGPEETLVAKDQAAALRRALGRLAPKERSLLYLKEVEGLSLAELGRVFELPEGTVKSRLFRARARLRRILEEDGYVVD